MEDLRSLVLVELEGQYGTDATPSASSNAIVTLGQPTFEVMTKQLERNVPLAHFGQVAPTVIGESLKLNFQVELKGSSSAGTAPEIAPLFKSANFTETVNAGTSVVYSLNSDYEGSSATFYFYVSGSLHKITGAVCNLKFNMQAGERITMDVEASGLYSGTHVSDVTFPTATFSTTDPLIWENANFVFASKSDLVCNKLNIDLGNEIAKRTDANTATGISRYFVKNRGVGVDFQVEKVALTELNPWDLHKNQTPNNLETKPDGVAGNLLEIAVNDLYLDPPKYAELEEVRMWDLTGTARPGLTSGNNEVTVTFK